MRSVYWALPVRLRGVDPPTDVVRALRRSKVSVRFVQIGANDGATGDHLSNTVVRHGWNGIMVEPHPDSFAKLSDYFGDLTQISLANVAICSDTGVREFYYLPNNPLVASFSKDHVRKFAAEANEVRSIDVQCETMMRFLQTHGVDSTDLLAIDTEGYDGEILRSINFDQFQAEAILFETVHLNDKDKSECFRLLAENSFQLMHGAHDTVAVRIPNRYPRLEALVRAYRLPDQPA
ncbi:FkbM family methyltransferase [Aporhodopirellula rubra]|nr:FkbM family methyltransferase [Aporhodopirellula rubra]